MTKTFSKVIAVILSLCVLFALPVIANAESETFDLTAGTVKAVSGNWRDDYIGNVTVTFKGSVDSVVATDAILTIGDGESLDNIKTVNLSDAVVTLGNGEVIVSVNLDLEVGHDKTYNFTVVEGAFSSAEGALSLACTASATGNELIETLDKTEIPLTPVEKIIEWLDGMDAGVFRFLIDLIISVLNWFINI